MPRPARQRCSHSGVKRSSGRRASHLPPREAHTQPGGQRSGHVVDDPGVSVERAAGVVAERGEALIVSVKEEQHALLSDWQANDTATEELRTALQRYRTFWNRVEDLSRES